MSTALEQPTKQAAAFVGEVAIEICGPRNSDVVWAPTSQVLRGRFRMNQLLPAEAGSEGIDKVPPEITGMRVSINGRTRVGRIWDPLSEMAQSQKLDDRMLIERLTKAQGVLSNSKPSFTHTPLNKKNMTDDDLKLWLWEARKLLDNVGNASEDAVVYRDGEAIEIKKGDIIPAPLAVEVSGKVPSRDEILRLPGKLRVGVMDSNWRRYPKWHEEDPNAQEEIALQRQREEAAWRGKAG